MTFYEQTPAARPTTILEPPISRPSDGPEASQTPIPIHNKSSSTDSAPSSNDAPPTTTTTSPKPFPLPTLRLEVRHLTHPASNLFFTSINPATVLADCLQNVLRLLYHTPQSHHFNPPPTRSVTLILRDMDGVAYTTGTDLDHDHKEIHFNLNHISNTASRSPSSNPTRVRDEIIGVITHELVHCYQWDAKHSCPGGLIEGIADWVRLNCDLSPPHWKKEVDGAWDRGYQHTAYFLQYLEDIFGPGTIRRLNEKLRHHKYHKDSFWEEQFGLGVEELYDGYVQHHEEEERKKKSC
ncbi:peptidase of plants and bacteria-domain-containing protein [Triangularia verruculosa]|uniref:Peptidase of plants and bacteria-domain-containing protein n=1 Tax=Triangularia verruculosa TaxID=2587418 RepID=A0AAN6XGG1_9PEZI|nr:peptidase of plants and bacteria-domain-containing protein [Triangularia verruculosa]